MKNLFLICPDCHIEQAIRNRYGEESYFLTALGTVFNIDTFEYTEEVNQFIAGEEVGSIYIVNDFNCTFIQNTIMQNKNFETKAEKVLKELCTNNDKEIQSLSIVDDRAKKLTRLNIFRQAFELLDVAFIGNKIQDGLIKVYGLIYDREDRTFEEFIVKI